MITQELMIALNKNWYKEQITQEEKVIYYGKRDVTHSKETDGSPANDWRPETVYFVKKETVRISKDDYIHFGGTKDVLQREINPFKDYLALHKEILQLSELNNNLTNAKKIRIKLKKLIVALKEVKKLAEKQVYMINRCIAMYDYLDAEEFINEFLTKELTDFSDGEIISIFENELKEVEELIKKLTNKQSENKKQRELKKLEKEQKELQEKINKLK